LEYLREISGKKYFDRIFQKFCANKDYPLPKLKFGDLEFADQNLNLVILSLPITVTAQKISTHANLLNKVWYQPEEIFHVNGIPEDKVIY